MIMPLELALDPLTLGALVCVAFVAGLIDAIAGGGGLLTIPSLLMAGIPPHMALGTNKLCASMGAITSSLTFIKRRLFSPKHWIPALICTAIGALLGAWLAHFIPAQWLYQLLPVVVFSCGLYMLFAPLPNSVTLSSAPPKQGRQVPQGLTLGFYDGIAGPGTGAFWTVSNLLLYPLDLLRASAVARCMNCISNVAALSVFIAMGQVYWLLGLCMGTALMLGAFIGARMAISGGAKIIRPFFILVVLALTAKLAWQYWLG